MSGLSDIEWTDATWNPVTGCSHVSEGCKNCYAEDIAGRKLPKGGFTDRPFTEVRCHPERLDWPLGKKKPLRIFVNSMSDLFHEDVPDDFIDRVFASMSLAPQHTFQILTKRPARMLAWAKQERHGFVEGRAKSMMRERGTPIPAGMTLLKWPLPHVWLGVSVENQRTADERIPLLLQTPAAVRFLSCEPLLGPVDISHWLAPRQTFFNALDEVCGHILKENVGPTKAPSDKALLDWLIVGGESGPKARPCDVAWIRSIVQQGKAAGVPVFCKQMGAHITDRNDAGFEGWEPNEWPLGTETDEFWNDPLRRHQGAPCRVILRNRKGGDPAEWPQDLRVREFPR